MLPAWGREGDALKPNLQAILYRKRDKMTHTKMNTGEHTYVSMFACVI